MSISKLDPGALCAVMIDLSSLLLLLLFPFLLQLLLLFCLFLPTRLGRPVLIFAMVEVVKIADLL